jgi:hypothetical protein
MSTSLPSYNLLERGFVRPLYYLNPAFNLSEENLGPSVIPHQYDIGQYAPNIGQAEDPDDAPLTQEDDVRDFPDDSWLRPQPLPAAASATALETEAESPPMVGPTDDELAEYTRRPERAPEIDWSDDREPPEELVPRAPTPDPLLGALENAQRGERRSEIPVPEVVSEPGVNRDELLAQVMALDRVREMTTEARGTATLLGRSVQHLAERIRETRQLIVQRQRERRRGTVWRY